jgi:hypothetical protein
VALARGKPATAGIGILVLGVDGFPNWPAFEVRLLRNRIAAIAGPGIVLDSPAVMMSVLDNTIQATIGAGIVSGPAVLVGDLLIGGNEILVVNGPPLPGTTNVFGIAVGMALNAIVRDNTVGAIGIAPVAENIGPTGILLMGVGTGTLADNNIRSIGPGLGSMTFGLFSAGITDDLSVSGNVIHQDLAVAQPLWIVAPPMAPMFQGISVLAEANIMVSVQDNAVEASSLQPLIFIQGKSDCVAAGNRCRLDTVTGWYPELPIVRIEAATAVASNNRIQGQKDITGLGIFVGTAADGKTPAATVLGNIVGTGIRLGTGPLQAPWAPLNVIV